MDPAMFAILLPVLKAFARKGMLRERTLGWRLKRMVNDLTPPALSRLIARPPPVRLSTP